LVLFDEELGPQSTTCSKHAKTAATSAKTTPTKPSSAAKNKTTIINKSAAKTRAPLAKPVARARDTEREEITKERQARPSIRARMRARISGDLDESDSDDE